MDIHKNARTTPYSRALIARRLAAGERPGVVARELGVCERTVTKWAARAAEGDLALEDRSCRPHDSPRGHFDGPDGRDGTVAAALALDGGADRRERGRGRRPRAPCASSASPAWTPSSRSRPADATRGRAPGNCCTWISRNSAASGRSAIGSPATGASARGASAGSSCTSALMTARAWPTSRSCPMSAASPWSAFLRRALTWFARRGVAGERILTDNGSAYRSRLLAAVCRACHLAQRFTRPYTPRTNGKAERFIQTLLREWAYRIAYPSSAQRTAVLARWLHYYNWHRRHSALHGRPPISRVLSQDNLLSLHS
jgi:integrase-like protein/transposase IS481 family protein